MNGVSLIAQALFLNTIHNNIWYLNYQQNRRRSSENIRKTSRKVWKLILNRSSVIKEVAYLCDKTYSTPLLIDTPFTKGAPRISTRVACYKTLIQLHFMGKISAPRGHVGKVGGPFWIALNNMHVRYWLVFRPSIRGQRTHGPWQCGTTCRTLQHTRSSHCPVYARIFEKNTVLMRLETLAYPTLVLVRAKFDVFFVRI